MSQRVKGGEPMSFPSELLIEEFKVSFSHPGSNLFFPKCVQNNMNENGNHRETPRHSVKMRIIVREQYNQAPIHFLFIGS
jgi:hypothetical protein